MHNSIEAMTARHVFVKCLETEARKIMNIIDDRNNSGRRYDSYLY